MRTYLTDFIKDTPCKFKALGEVAEVGTGSSNGNEAVDNGKYPLFVRSKIVKSINTFEFDEEAIVIPGEGGVGEIFHHINGKYALHQRAYRIHFTNSEMCTRFAYYYLFANFLPYILRKSVNATVKSIRKPMIQTFQIPIPPLTIQKEIVKILDNFTRLEAELEAELEARKKQYEHYREELLTFGDDVERKALGEVGEFVRGNGLPKSDFTGSGVGCIHYGQIYTYYGTFTDKTKSFVSPETAKKLQKVHKNDLIITNTSENIEDVCKTVVWLGNDVIVTGGHASIFKHNENPKYLAYYTQTQMFSTEKRKLAKGTKVIDVSAKDLAKIKIPIPSLSKQKEIVAILDKFDALVNDLPAPSADGWRQAGISTGLPAEIDARKKQYEYYRNQLLEFKVKNSEL